MLVDLNKRHKVTHAFLVNFTITSGKKYGE